MSIIGSKLFYFNNKITNLLPTNIHYHRFVKSMGRRLILLNETSFHLFKIKCNVSAPHDFIFVIFSLEIIFVKLV